MSKKTPFSNSLSSLSKKLKLAFGLEKRSRLRAQADGKLFLFFAGNDGQAQVEEIRMKDMFAGGIAFRSQQLLCIGSHICISDGVEAMEVSVENRREDGSSFVYSVLLGQLSPLAESWQHRLEPEASLADIMQRCKELSTVDPATARTT